MMDVQTTNWGNKEVSTVITEWEYGAPAEGEGQEETEEVVKGRKCKR